MEMNTSEERSRRMRWCIVLFCAGAAAAIGLGLTRLSRSLADSPDPKLADEVVLPMARHKFIGLPDFDTISIQNILDEMVDITVTVALPSGTVIETFTDTVPPESMYLYGDPENLTGLARIKYAERKLLFGVNFELPEENKGNDAYLGLKWEEFPSSPPGPFILIPLVMRAYDGWNTAFTLLNRSGQDATVVVSFYDRFGWPVHQEDKIMSANGSVSLDLADMVGISDGYIGSAVIASDQALAVASARTYHDVLGLRSAYQGVNPEEMSTTLIAPALFKASNLQTSEICVQNAGPAETDVAVNYSDDLTLNEPIPSLAVHCFEQGMEGHASGWSGGAVITSTGEPLVAVVNVTAYNGTTPVGRWSYTVPSQDMVEQVLAFPLLLNNSSGWTSEVHLYNFNDSSSVITPRYVSYPPGFVHCAEPFTIPAHSVLSISQAELPHVFRQSMAYFIATQPVAAAVSATSNKPLGDTDRHFGYGAAYTDKPIDPPDTCDTIREVFLPAVLSGEP